MAGLELIPVQRPPSIFPRGGWIYYEVQRDSPIFKHVKSEQSLALRFAEVYIDDIDNLQGSQQLKIIINKKSLDVYFPNEQDRLSVLQPLEAVGKRNEVDVLIRVEGGGNTGQSGACRMGIARALVSYDTEVFSPLRDGGFLTRDSRMKERKKYGLRGARRGVQFSKR